MVRASRRKLSVWSACANPDVADSNMARDSFATFIPLSVDSDARTKIIFDFFELLAAIAAHGKTNGLGGRKLSRLAGWWAFEHNGSEKGFDGGYKGWTAYVSRRNVECLTFHSLTISQRGRCDKPSLLCIPQIDVARVISRY